MKAIKINFNDTKDDLTGKSKWWGAPDLPSDWDYPCLEDEDSEPLTFICQIRCSDLAELDSDNLLPHEGMLYFFAAIDEYMYDEDEDYECPFHNGLGEWDAHAYRVLYSPGTDDLEPYEILYDDDSPAFLPAESISFESCGEASDDFKLLGTPFFDEVKNQYEDYVSLLQIDEEERWGLRFYDCGMLNFLIKPEDLKQKRFEKTLVYFESL